MKKVALHNLGCKVNSYETEVMQQKLQERGFQIVDFDEVADIYIVNTCTVTNMADRKSRQMLHRAKQRNPEAVVVAVGCYVQTGTTAVLQDEAIDLAVGNNRKKDIVELLEEYLQIREQAGEQEEFSAASFLQKTVHDKSLCDINHTYEYEEMQLGQTAEHTRAYIKIQDGCNQFCSYCAIPYARGRVRSRAKENILEEIRGLVKKGYKEVVLTGIHISSYGVDFDDRAWQQGICEKIFVEGQPKYTGRSKLVDLTEEICQIDGLHRVRLGSLEPRIVTEDAARRLSVLDKLCPHFHLSLQSGCDATLKRMNRKYTADEYYNGVQCLRKYFAHPAITTDVIVGFPGETQEEYQQTKDFLEKVGFFEMHIFKYSKRAGTVADGLLGQVSEKEKTIRSNELLAMESAMSKEYRARYIGKEAEVLIEEAKEIDGQEYYVGHTVDYVKMAVPKTTGNNLENSFVVIHPTAFLTEEILV